MLFRNRGVSLRFSLLTVAIAIIALLVMRAPTGVAQEAKRASGPAGNGGDVARGAYIVNEVAMCGTCHTPRHPDGRLDRSQWLQGASVPYLPAQPTANWPLLAPRIGGTPPASNEQMVTLLTTAVWITGAQLRDPMPKFHMNRADAEAVVAYLRTVVPSR